MTAYIATLEGEYPTRRYPYSGRRYSDARVETMDGLGDLWTATKGLTKSATRVALAPIRGTIHVGMEVGRGIKNLDPKRVLTAPLKGIGHTTGEAFRGVRNHAEWYWRPSKMSKWMGPAGAGMSAVAPFTGPAAPFLMAGGAALTVGGMVGTSLHKKDLAKKAAKTQDAETKAMLQARAAAAGKSNKLWLGIGAAALVGGAAIMLM